MHATLTTEPLQSVHCEGFQHVRWEVKPHSSFSNHSNLWAQQAAIPTCLCGTGLRILQAAPRTKSPIDLPGSHKATQWFLFGAAAGSTGQNPTTVLQEQRQEQKVVVRVNKLAWPTLHAQSEHSYTLAHTWLEAFTLNTSYIDMSAVKVYWAASVGHFTLRVQ